MTDKLARAQLARAAFALKAKHAMPALVLMTDDRLADPIAAARALPRGSTVILRAKDDAKRAMLAAKLRPITRSGGTKLLVADDTALAQRVGADGIHLPEARARQAAHWRARQPGWIITAAAHSLWAAHVGNVDALILAPVFPTRSHPGGNCLGPIHLRLIAQQVRIPIYALGGINAVTARQLRGAKLAGLAAIDALSV
jgi:thiamine-phosphate pyrophosphorylase